MGWGGKGRGVGGHSTLKRLARGRKGIREGAREGKRGDSLSLREAPKGRPKGRLRRGDSGYLAVKVGREGMRGRGASMGGV